MWTLPLLHAARQIKCSDTEGSNGTLWSPHSDLPQRHLLPYHSLTCVHFSVIVLVVAYMNIWRPMSSEPVHTQARTYPQESKRALKWPTQLIKHGQPRLAGIAIARLIRGNDLRPL